MEKNTKNNETQSQNIRLPKGRWEYICEIDAENECWEFDGKSYRVPIEIVRYFNDAELIKTNEA